MDRRRLIVQEIQNRISSGRLPRGVRLPSERKFAAELGVSRTLVQAAFKDLESLGIVSRLPNCRPVVASAPSKQQFGPGTADQIALWMLPESQDVGGSMILAGIRSAFSEEHYSLLITSPPSYEPEAVRRAELQFLRSAKENPRVAGVVMWDTGNADCRDRYRDLVNFGLPLVFVDRAPGDDIPADVVAVNHRKAAKQAVSHLLELGHRTIAMVLGDDRASSVLDRIEGYECALREHGIQSDPALLLCLDGRGSDAKKCAEDVLDRVSRDPDGPTAIFAVNDQIAFYLLEAAESKGIRIPEQISLVGFDWLARWMPSGGTLTTVAQPFEELGRTAAERILSRLAKPNQTPRQILLDAELVLKESAAAPPKHFMSGARPQRRKKS